MMTTSYKVPLATSSSEQLIKNSRFICHLGPASTREQALQEIESIRAQHPRANHVCWAYIAGPPSTAVKDQSDDGEPRGTAGKPMLTIIEHSGFGEIWTTVTRYFGGIKLGTGGLVRAYGSSVRQTLDIADFAIREPQTRCILEADYRHLATIEAVVRSAQGSIVDKDFGERVLVTMLIPEHRFTAIRQQLIDSSRGGLILRKSAPR
jgi:uncharacterized YigZ family protein